MGKILGLSALALVLAAPAADAGPVRRAVARVVAGPRCGQVRPALAFPRVAAVAVVRGAVTGDSCPGGRCAAPRR